MKKTIFLVSIYLFLSGCATLKYVAGDSFIRGENNFASGNYEKAVKEYTRFLKSDPKDERRVQAEIKLSRAYYKLGEDYYQKGYYNEALDFFYSVNTVEADREMAKCHYALANKLTDQGKYSDALKHLTIVIKDYTNSELCDDCLYLKLKIEFENLNNENEALNTYKQLIEHFSQSEFVEKGKEITNKIAVLFIGKADALYVEGNYDRAIEIYKDIQSWTFNYKDEVETKIEKAKVAFFLKQGNMAIAQKDWENAESSYKSVLEIDQYNDEANKKLKSVYTFREKAERQEKYNRLISEHPEWSRKMINLIMQQKIAEGMTREMVEESWGKPDDIRHTYFYGTIYIYWSDPIYGKTVKVQFENGKCIKIYSE